MFYLGELGLGLRGNAGEDCLLSVTELLPETGLLVGVGLTEGGGQGGGGEVGLLGGVTACSESGGGSSKDKTGSGAALHAHADIAGGAAKAGLKSTTCFHGSVYSPTEIVVSASS